MLCLQQYARKGVSMEANAYRRINVGVGPVSPVTLVQLGQRDTARTNFGTEGERYYHILYFEMLVLSSHVPMY